MAVGGGCEATRTAADAVAVAGDRYPVDISPPPGTAYPCALTALPRDLPGVPAGDRTYLNHVYADVLAATRAKLAFLRDSEASQGSGQALALYRAELVAARERLRAERPPSGLETFQADIDAAFELQLATFESAAREGAGGVFRAALSRPEARLASRRLKHAWGEMARRYPKGAVRDSLYHHLCALDLF